MNKICLDPLHMVCIGWTLCNKWTNIVLSVPGNHRNRLLIKNNVPWRQNGEYQGYFDCRSYSFREQTLTFMSRASHICDTAQKYHPHCI